MYIMLIKMGILGFDCKHSLPVLLLYRISFYFCSVKCAFRRKWVIMCNTHRTGVGGKPFILQNACLHRMITKLQITKTKAIHILLFPICGPPTHQL